MADSDSLKSWIFEYYSKPKNYPKAEQHAGNIARRFYQNNEYSNITGITGEIFAKYFLNFMVQSMGFNTQLSTLAQDNLGVDITFWNGGSKPEAGASIKTNYNTQHKIAPIKKLGFSAFGLCFPTDDSCAGDLIEEFNENRFPSPSNFLCDNGLFDDDYIPRMIAEQANAILGRKAQRGVELNPQSKKVLRVLADVSELEEI